MNIKNPPGWALSMLQFFFKERYLEQIEGDLLELFHREGSGRKARWKFGLNTLKFFRLRYLKGLDDFEQLATIAMIKNYLKISIRTLLKQKSYAAINIVGLAIGLASCLLIFMYIAHERSYDNFYPDVDRMYRIANGERGRFTPQLLATTMMKDYPQVESATKITGLGEGTFKIGDRIIVQDGGCWADNEVFNVFNMKFLSGSPEDALKEPENLVLTTSMARKFFPNEPALGQTVVFDGESMQVTAIVEDPPKNTHFPFKYIVANPNDRFGSSNWTGNNYWTYAKIQPGVSVEEMTSNLQDLYKNYIGPEIIEFSGHSSFEEFVADYPDRFYGFTLHPVDRIHLYEPWFSMGPQGDYKNVIVFTSIALFILLIACVNYINMSTARSAIRSKEVGIRKALGSYRKNIISQFLTESLLITFLAILLALIIGGSSLPYFNELTGRVFEYGDLFSPSSVLSIVALLLIVGLFAGAYPAYVISSFSPLKALRGHLQQAGKKGLRSGLVAFQFSISIFLVAATLVIYQQVQFMLSQELGVNIDQTLVIYNGQELDTKYTLFKTQLEQRSDIQIVSKSQGVPFHGFGDWTYQIPAEDNRRTAPYNTFISPGVEKILDLELVEGRFLEEDRVTDTAAVLINEALVKELGWSEPLGKKFARQIEFTVVGVVKDFNFASLKREIGPMIIRYGHENSEVGDWHQRYILAKVNSPDILKTVAEIEELWDQHVPDSPFDASFLNESFQRQYEAERKFGKVFTTFSLLAIFIAFLGLFALTTFVLQKRVKEIAVRKVLGASVSSLLQMMIKDFTRLVLIGGVVGIIVAFYWLENWLQDYSYRIELSWYLLALPVLIIMALTWMVVSLKSYKAATANPSNALKEE